MNDCSVLYWPISRFCRSRDNVSLVKIEIKTEKIVDQLRTLLRPPPHYAAEWFVGKNQDGPWKKPKNQNRQNWKLKFQRFETFLISLKEAPPIKIVTKYVIDRNDKGNIFWRKTACSRPKILKQWSVSFFCLSESNFDFEKESKLLAFISCEIVKSD